LIPWRKFLLIQKKLNSWKMNQKPRRQSLRWKSYHLTWSMCFLNVIKSSYLSSKEEKKLIQILNENKDAIGWTLSDLKRISSSYCIHKIMMEDNFKPVAQPQRRLNPTMKEVVRKEVVKLLEVGIIYPILDSAWLSPVQVFPKKGGMTVIRNDKNELIPTSFS